MIDRCYDYRRIKKFPDWRLCVSSKVYYLMEIKDGVDLGVWALHPKDEDDITNLTIHANLGEGCRGRDAIESAKNAFKWIFNNTEFKHIIADIPNDKRHAQFMARWSGMKPYGSSDKNRSYSISFYDVINCVDIKKAV